MKHFLVADDVGTPIYFDHPEGRMLTLPISTTHDVMSANFQDTFTSMTAGNMQFVFQKFDHLCFTIISDGGEPESYLRSQLRLLHELLLLIFGPKMLYSRRQTNLLKHQKSLQKIIDTMCWLGDKYQSFLVESIESVEVNDKLRSNWVDTLKKSLERFPKALHAYIFVGTKLLASYTKPKAQEISVSDLYLLIVYFMGQFHPQVRQMEETSLPVADYTDHSRIPPVQPIPEEEDPSAINSLEDDFTSATEEWDIDDFKPEADAEQLLFLNDEFCAYFEEMMKEYEADGEETDRLKTFLQNLVGFMLYHLGDGTLSTFINKIKSLNDIIHQGVNVANATEVQLLQVLLNASGSCEAQSVDGIFTEKTKECIVKFQETINVQQTGAPDKSTTRILVLSISKSAEPASPYKKSVHTVNNNSTTGSPRTPYSELKVSSRWRSSPKEDEQEIGSPYEHTERNPSSSPSPPAFSYVYKSPFLEEKNTPISKDVVMSLSTSSILNLSLIDELPKEVQPPNHPTESEEPPSKPADPIYSQLFLRTPGYTPYWVYSAEIEESVTLVILNKNQTGSPEEKEHLNALLVALRHQLKNYIDYLITKARTHISVLSYVHQLPGLIHFIYIDRTTNRVVAPIIGPLHGQQYEQNDETTQRMIKMLTKRVWDMCYQAQRHLSMGYCSMLTKEEHFQYSYRLWLEDNDNTEVSFDQELVGNTLFSGGHSFYKELIKRTPRATKCYELYSIFLGMLPVNIVASHERKLLQLMNPNRKFSDR